MSDTETTADLLDRIQAEADTWSVEEPERALWMEAKAEIERLRYALRQCGNGYSEVSAYAREALESRVKLIPPWSRNATPTEGAINGKP